MMQLRILFYCFLSAIYWLPAGLALAADDGFGLQKADLISGWNQKEGFTSAFSFTADAGWGLIDSNISVVLRSPNDKTGYSTCGLGFAFPEFTPDFKLALNYGWNEKYRLVSSESGYKFKLWKNMIISCGYMADRRDALPGWDNQYYYFSDGGKFGLRYRLADFSYHIDYTYTDKNYPEAQYYSSQKQKLKQEIVWQPGDQSRFLFGYNENSGDYPYDLSYTRGFWEANWVLKGEHRFNKDFRWDWEYGQMEMDQGYIDKRSDRHLRQKMIRLLDPSSSLVMEVVLAEKLYSGAVDYDPDEDEFNPFEDSRSRNEQKILVQYHRKWGKTIIDLGLYGEYLHYYYQDPINNRIFNLGFIGTVTFYSEHWRFTIKAAPEGDLRGRLSYYQLKLGYNP